MHSSNVSGFLWVVHKLSSWFSHFSNAGFNMETTFFTIKCGVFENRRTGWMSLFTVFSISPSHLWVSKIQCCYKPSPISIVFSGAYLLWRAWWLLLCWTLQSRLPNSRQQLKESYPVEPLRLRTKSEMQIPFFNLHFWLLSKIISLGLTIVFSAAFLQTFSVPASPFYSLWTLWNLHVIHPWPVWFHFKDSPQRNIVCVSVSAQRQKSSSSYNNFTVWYLPLRWIHEMNNYFSYHCCSLIWILNFKGLYLFLYFKVYKSEVLTEYCIHERL